MHVTHPVRVKNCRNTSLDKLELLITEIFSIKVISKYALSLPRTEIVSTDI